MRLDTTANRLGLEVRDGDLLLADFYSLELSRNELTKLPLPAAKNWWLGLEDAHESLLLLHGYGNRQVGEHKGIFAYSSETGKLAWEQPELAFYGIAATGVLALEPEQKTLVQLQPDSGTIVRQNVSLVRGAEEVANYSRARYQHCTYPMLYLEGEKYFAEVADFLRQQLHVEPMGGIEYAEAGEYIVVSYYTTAANSKTDNMLSVFDLHGKPKLNKHLARGLSGIGSDTFIIFNQKLYFIQDRNTLVVHNLT
nr:DUF4905 domain-containing protein [Pontibacter sp. Tf4]